MKRPSPITISDLAAGKVFHVHLVKTIYHLPLARPDARHGNGPLIRQHAELFTSLEIGGDFG